MVVRVLVVTNMPSTYNTDLFDRLSEQASIDLHVVYLTPSTVGRSWKQPARMDHSHTLLHPWPRNSALYWSPGSITAARSWSPDVTILCQYANLPIQILAPLLRFGGSRVVSWLEPPGVKFSEAPVMRSTVLRRAGRSLATNLLRRSSDELWSITEEGRLLYEELGKWRASRVMPYFGGLHTTPAAEDRPAITEFSKDRPMRLLYAGKMVTRKGVDLLAEAVLELRRRDDLHLDVRFLGNGPLYPEVARMFENVPNVEMIAQVERDQMLSQYEWADVCVMPSRYDGWGMVAIEAVAMGCAVISTLTSGSARDALAPHDACLLVEPVAREISDAIEALHRSPRLLHELSSAGRLVADNLSAEAGALRFTEAIEELLSRQ